MAPPRFENYLNLHLTPLSLMFRRAAHPVPQGHNLTNVELGGCWEHFSYIRFCMNSLK